MTILDLSADQYHADATGDERPSLSSSIANLICAKSPLHAWWEHPRLNPHWEPRVEDKFDLGTAAHDFFLDGGTGIAVCEFKDWRSNDAKAAKAEARAAGRTAVLPHQMRRIREMADAMNLRLAETETVPRPFTDGKAEVAITWEEEGVFCRARLDWIRDDLQACDDLKTTEASAKAEAFERRIYDQGADIQVALYQRGLRAVFGQDVAWRWCVVESSPPYGLSIVYPGADVLALGNAKIDYALSVWRECLERGYWPCYPTAATEAVMPPYEEARWMERMAREEVAA